MNSTHYTFLAGQVNSISRRLPNTRKLGDYNDAELMDICFFRIMAHAEIEIYFEHYSKYLVKKALDLFGSGKITVPLLYLAASIKKIDFQNKDLFTHLHSAKAQHSKVSKNNNGISGDYFYELFSFVGVDHTKVSRTLISSLNTFADLRGAVAHLGMTGTIFPKSDDDKAPEVIPNPQDDLRIVNFILTELEALDEMLLATVS